MVRPRHCPHHARPDGAVFLDRPGGSLAATREPHHPAHGGLVRQTRSHFLDAIALVRRRLWLASERFSMSVADTETRELPIALYHRLVDSLTYAA